MRQKDLDDLALRLEDEEKLNLRYRWPVKVQGDGSTQYEEHIGPLLDVSEETGVLFVSQDGKAMVVRLEEAIEVLPASEE